MLQSLFIMSLIHITQSCSPGLYIEFLYEWKIIRNIGTGPLMTLEINPESYLCISFSCKNVGRSEGDEGGGNATHKKWGRTLTRGRGGWLKDINEGCCQLKVFPLGTLEGGTQEVELSGGQRPLNTPGQETRRAYVCVCVVILMDASYWCGLYMLQLQHVVFISRAVIDLFAQSWVQFKNLAGRVACDGVMRDYTETH